MIRLFGILIALLCVIPVSAQNAGDSLRVESNFRVGEIIMPLSLIGAGTLGFVEPIRNSRYEVRDFLDEWRGDHRVTADDYLQYVPLASVYGLSLLGVEAKHGYVDRTLQLATSYVALGVIVNGINIP